MKKLKKRGRPKKEIKKEKIKREITCKYCQEFEKPSTCKTTNKILPRQQETPRCKEDFKAIEFFYCERNGQRFDILTCLNRRNCVKHKVRLYLSFGKCRRCSQYSTIKKIAREEDIQPPQIVKLKRRGKTVITRREKPKTIIRRREKITITRREKPKTIIRRRNKKTSKLRRRKNG